jgi:hypothetical protein
VAQHTLKGVPPSLHLPLDTAIRSIRVLHILLCLEPHHSKGTEGIPLSAACCTVSHCEGLGVGLMYPCGCRCSEEAKAIPRAHTNDRFGFPATACVLPCPYFRLCVFHPGGQVLVMVPAHRRQCAPTILLQSRGSQPLTSSQVRLLWLLRLDPSTREWLARCYFHLHRQ